MLSQVVSIQAPSAKQEKARDLITRLDGNAHNLMGIYEDTLEAAMRKAIRTIGIDSDGLEIKVQITREGTTWLIHLPRQ